MTDLKAPVRQFFIYAAGSIIGNAANFLLLPVISRHLGPEKYGLFSLTFVLFSLLVLVFDLGLVQALVKFHGEAGSPDEKRSAFTAIAVLTGLLCLPLVLIVWLAAPAVSAVLYGPAGTARYVRIGTLAAAAAVLFQLALALFRSRLSPAKHLAASAARALLFFILTLTVLPRAEDPLTALLYCWAGPYVIMGFTLLPFVLIRYYRTPDFSRARAFFAYALPLVPAGIILWLLTHIDLYLIRRLGTITDVGVYTLGTQVCFLLSPLAVAIQMGWLPFVFSVSSRQDAPDLYARLFGYVLAAAVFISLGATFFSSELVRLLSTEAFSSSSEIIPVLLLGVVFYIMFLIFVTGLNIKGRTRPVPLVTLAAALTNIVLNSLFIPRWGILGAAWGTLAANLVLASGALIVSRRQYPIPFFGRPFLTVTVWTVVIYTLHTLVVFDTSGYNTGFSILLLLLYYSGLRVSGFFRPGPLAGIQESLQPFMGKQ